MKKEFKKFFGDRRMLMSLFLPGILIFAVYSLMGQFMGKIGKADKNHEYVVYVLNNPNDNRLVTDKYTITFTNIDNSDLNATKDKVKDKDVDLLIIFEENFKSKEGSNPAPVIELYYNSTNDNSFEIYNFYNLELNMNAISSINYNYYVNPNNDYDLATKEDVSTQVITMIVPFILMIFLFTGAMGIATESIAGEKERGTIATLLVTPTKKSEIALGKIFSLSITAMASAAVSFIFLLLSLPQLLKGMDGGITFDMYGFKEISLVFIIIIVSVVFFTTLISIISALAKTIKEATAYATPIMIITMVIGVTSMAGAGAIASNTAIYLIPIYNIVTCLTSIFAGEISVVNTLVTVASNIVYITAGIYLLTKLFNSEKIMFNK